MTKEADLHLRNFGRTIALDLLLRGLYTKWAMEAKDPLASNRRNLDGLIATLWQIAPPKDDLERRLYQISENTIAEFRDNVDARLRDLGASE